MLLALFLACAGAADDSAGHADVPDPSTTWYFGTNDGQTPDGSYVAPTEEELFIRALDPTASTVSENAWTVDASTQAVTSFALVHDVDVATETFSSTFVTDDGTLLVEGAYDAGDDWAWTAWHSTSTYQDGQYAGMRVESVDHVEDSGQAIAEKVVIDASGTETYDIVEVLTPTDQAAFEERLAELGG